MRIALGVLGLVVAAGDSAADPRTELTDHEVHTAFAKLEPAVQQCWASTPHAIDDILLHVDVELEADGTLGDFTLGGLTPDRELHACVADALGGLRVRASKHGMATTLSLALDRPRPRAMLAPPPNPQPARSPNLADHRYDLERIASDSIPALGATFHVPYRPVQHLGATNPPSIYHLAVAATVEPPLPAPVTIDCHHDVTPYRRAGRDSLATGQYDDALVTFVGLLTCSPDDAELRFDAYEAACRSGRYGYAHALLPTAETTTAAALCRHL